MVPSGELFGWSVGKTLPSGCQKCESQAEENDLGCPVSLIAKVMWVSVSVCFSGKVFLFFPTVKCELWFKL